MKSEEKFFGQVKKQKLSDAASIRSSQRDSIWGTADSMYSRPTCKSLIDCGYTVDDHMIPLLAPNIQAFPHPDYDTALNGDPNQPPVAPMTGLQITMSREIGGWPLYTIVIALGQVSNLLS
jgi:alpha-1,3-glucan synthase